MPNAKAKVADPHSFITCAGDRYHIEYEGKAMPDGTIVLVESGKTDIKEYINSFKNSTDIDYIRTKIEQGDMSVINRSKPQFGDFTEIPQSYQEALQLRIDAERQFKGLDLETRNKFDNDINKYLASAGTKEWAEKLGLKPAAQNVDAVADLVKDSEVDNNAT